MRQFSSLCASAALVFAALVGCTDYSGSTYRPELFQTGTGIRPQSPPITSVALPAPVSGPAIDVAAMEHHKIAPWRHFGADPFARSRAEAMHKREQAFRAMGISGVCLTNAMRATEVPGAVGRLSNGDRLYASMSGHGARFNVVLDARVKRGVEYVALTEEWTFECGGKDFRLILPEVCFNWSLAAPGPTTCVSVIFSAPVYGEVNWFDARTTGPLPASDCNALQQGNGPWTAWWGECPTCVPPSTYLAAVTGPGAWIPHRYRYQVSAPHQVLRFSTAVWASTLGLCLTYPDGSKTCGVYIRPQDWQGRYVIEIPVSLWRRNDGNCPE